MSRSFLNFFRDFFASLNSSFFEFGKILPHPREFDHHFLPRGRELDKKNCPGGRDSLAQKNFPGGGMYPVGIDWDIRTDRSETLLEIMNHYAGNNIQGQMLWCLQALILLCKLRWLRKHGFQPVSSNVKIWCDETLEFSQSSESLCTCLWKWRMNPVNNSQSLDTCEQLDRIGWGEE